MTVYGYFLTADEAAEFLRLPRFMIYKLTQDQILPMFIKAGRHWRHHRRAIDAWIRKQDDEHSYQGDRWG